MLYTLEQLKRSFTNMMFAGFAGNGEAPKNTEVDPDKSVQDIAEKMENMNQVLTNEKVSSELASYFRSLDTNKDGEISRKDKLSEAEQGLYKKVMTQLGYPETALDSSLTLKDIFNKVSQIANNREEKKKISKVQEMLVDMKELRADLEENTGDDAIDSIDELTLGLTTSGNGDKLTSTVNGNSVDYSKDIDADLQADFEPADARLTNQKYDKTFLGLKYAETTRSELFEKMSNASKKQLDSLFSAGLPRIGAALGIDENSTGIIQGDKLVSTINSLGYSFKNSDANVLYGYIMDFANLQGKLTNSDISESNVVDLLSDFNLDGQVSGLGLLLGEEQLKNAAELSKIGREGAGIDGLLRKIGYVNGIWDIKAGLSTNAYATIKQFHKTLNTHLSSRNISLAELLVSTKDTKDIMDSHIVERKKQIAEAMKEADKQFDADPKFSKLSESEKVKVKEFISVGISMGEIQGGGIALNIKEYTKGIFEHIGVANINGKWVAGITTSALEIGRASFRLAASITGMPALIGTVKITDGVSAYGSISLDLSAAIGVSKAIERDGNSHWVERQVSELLAHEEKVSEMVYTGKEYDSSLAPLTAEMYSALQKISKNVDKAEFGRIYQMTANAYKLELYKDNQGLDISAVGVGIAGSLANPGAYLGLLGLGLEYTKVKQFGIMEHESVQRENTKTKLDFKEVTDKETGKKVVLIPGMTKEQLEGRSEVKFYAPGQTLQGKYTEEGLMLSGNINSIDKSDTSKFEGNYDFDIVVNGVSKTQENLVSTLSPITQDVTSKGKEISATQQKIVDKQVGYKYNENGTNIIEKRGEAFNGLNAYSKGALDLRKSIHEDILVEGDLSNKDTLTKFSDFYKQLDKGGLGELSDAEMFDMLYEFSSRTMFDMNMAAMSGYTVEQMKKEFGGRFDANAQKTHKWINSMIDKHGIAYVEKALKRDKAFSDIFQKAFTKKGEPAFDMGWYDASMESVLGKFEKGEHTKPIRSKEPLLAFVASSPKIGGKRVFSGLTPMAGKLELATSKAGVCEEKIYDPKIRQRVGEMLPQNWINGLSAFVEKQTGQKLSNNEIKTLVSEGKVGEIQLDADVYAIKWGRCFNDGIALKNLVLKYRGQDISVPVDGAGIKGGADAASELGHGKTSISHLGFAVVDEVKNNQPQQTPEPDTKEDPDKTTGSGALDEDGNVVDNVNEDGTNVETFDGNDNNTTSSNGTDINNTSGGENNSEVPKVEVSNTTTPEAITEVTADGNVKTVDNTGSFDQSNGTTTTVQQSPNTTSAAEVQHSISSDTPSTVTAASSVETSSTAQGVKQNDNPF